MKCLRYRSAIMGVRGGLLLPLFAGLLWAAPPDVKRDAQAARVERLVVLVHPCPYQIREHARSGAATPASEAPYLEAERAVTERWRQLIGELPATTFVVQIDMPMTAPVVEELHAAFVKRLGAARVCRIPGEGQYPDQPQPLLDYYRRIDGRIRDQFQQQQLTFDPAACQTELWGQSFEGCAPGYCGAVARRLGLKQKPRFDYRLSVPDARFLLGAKHIQVIPLPQSDVEAYVFELSDGSLAVLFQARLNDQWLDRRPIELVLDPSKFSITTKQDKPVWPLGNTPAGPQKVKMTTADEQYLRAASDSLAGLRAMIQGARVGTAATPK